MKNANTEITFELDGAVYTRKASGYCYAQYNAETANTYRISKAKFESKYVQFRMMDMTITEIMSEGVREQIVEELERNAEEAYMEQETDRVMAEIEEAEANLIEAEEEAKAAYIEEAKAEEAVREFEEELKAEGREVVEYTGHKMPEYRGCHFPVRGGAWADPMNSCFYTVIDTIHNYEICRDHSTGEMFAIRNLNAEDTLEITLSGGAVEFHENAQSTEETSSTASKAKGQKKAKKTARRAKKNAAYMATINGIEITLTDKQVDFIRHLPDTCFWENGLDSCVWVDVLCDEIGGQFENKPMTVGAMISTICEKGLGSRGKDRINGRKATSFALTELGKEVAKELGLE